MLHPPMHRSVLSAACVAASLSLFAACSTSSRPHAATSPIPSDVSTAAPVRNAAASRNPATACAALPSFDAAMLAYPDSDNSPPPPPATLTRWAATAATPLQILAANVPAELDTDVNTVRAAIALTGKGKPLNTDDSSLIAALTALDHAAHDNCGFTRLDITSVGNNLTGIPASVPTGPVSVSFANHAPPNQSGFILLVARIHDGQPYTLDQIRNDTLDIAKIGDIVVAALPGPNGMAYATAKLTPGHYVVTVPIGNPAKVTRILARHFDVN
jgi:hypothetical protein